MNRKQTHLENLVLGLYAAIESNNWQAMAESDREVAALLSTLASREGWADEVAPALQKLGKAHRHAREHCARELENMGRQLEELRQHKEGWIAYALNGNGEEGRA
jgi:hypothetical protein